MPSPPDHEKPFADGISAAELSSLTGLTDRRHRQLAGEGYFRPPIRGAYGPDVVPGLFKYFQEQARKKNTELAQEELKLTTAKRKTCERELAILDGEFVETKQIGPILYNVSLNQRSVLQQKIERELAPSLEGLKTKEILTRCAAVVDEVCKIFREGTKEWVKAAALPTAPVTPPVKKKKPAAKKKAKNGNG